MDHSLTFHIASTSSLASSELSAISGASDNCNGNGTSNGFSNSPVLPSVETLGKLVVDMKGVIQEERWKRSEIEKRNTALVQELEHLQREVIDLKTNNVQLQHDRARAAKNEPLAAAPPAPATLGSSSTTTFGLMGNEDPSQHDMHDAEFWMNEVQQARKDKQKAVVEAHQKAMQVMELNACVSMQHDEIKALRTQENETRFALINAEDRVKELVHQNTLCQQENNLLKDDVSHLTQEINKRSAQVTSLLEKYTTCQTLYDQSLKENQQLGEKLKNSQFEVDRVSIELVKTVQERDELQHQVNQLKGAVAAKCAESKAFQAYGTNAREYLQNQNNIIQRNVVHRRKTQKVTRDAILTLRAMKTSLVTIREPLVAMQRDFLTFCRQLQGPVLTLVRKSQKFVSLAQDEVQPLRDSLLHTEQARKHLHEQVWRAHNNSLMVCQIRHMPSSSSNSASPQQLSMGYPLDKSGTSGSPSQTNKQMFTLNANYALKQIVYKQNDSDAVLAIPFDAIYSDKTHEWNANDGLRPLVQSVLDGKNACVATIDGFMNVQVANATGTSTISMGDRNTPKSNNDNSVVHVPDLVIHELFNAIGPAQSPLNHFTVTLSYLAVFDEQVFDLLAIADHPVVLNNNNSSKTSGGEDPNKQMVVLQVQTGQDMAIALREAREKLLVNKNQSAKNSLVPQFAHQVLTFGIVNESVLTNQQTKSKLQIVVLAQPAISATSATTAASSTEPVPSVSESEEPSDALLKTFVTMENGTNALINALAETRYKDPAFVRYHSSKITLLLQETLHFSSKFMLMVSLCTNFPREVQQDPTNSNATQLKQVIDKLQYFRSALYGNGGLGGASSTGKMPLLGGGSASTTADALSMTNTPKLFANIDRSFQGFMSRFYQCQSDAFPEQLHISNLRCFPLTFPNGTSLSNCSPLQNDKRLFFETGTWEKELDRMTKRSLDIQNRPQTLYQSFSLGASGSAGRSGDTPLTTTNGNVSSISMVNSTNEPTLYETQSFNALSQNAAVGRSSVVLTSRNNKKQLARPHLQRAPSESLGSRSFSASETMSRTGSLLRHTASSYSKLSSKPQPSSSLNRMMRQSRGSSYELYHPSSRDSSSQQMMQRARSTSRSFGKRRPLRRALTLASSSLLEASSSSSNFLVHARRETASSARKRVMLNRSSKSMRTIPFR